MDILEKVYESLVADDYIKEQALGRIKYYEYPETGDVDKPYIVIVSIIRGCRGIYWIDNNICPYTL